MFSDKLKLSFLLLASEMSEREFKEKAGVFTDIFNTILASSQHKEVHLSHPLSHPMIKTGVN